MTDSILIGKYLYSRLATIPSIEGKVFPVVADQSTTYPFIIYQRTNITSDELSKDGYGEDTVDFSVIVVSEHYDDSCELANAVRHLLEKKMMTYDSMEIRDCHLVGISEAYSEGAFIQSLSFNCIIN